LFLHETTKTATTYKTKVVTSLRALDGNQNRNQNLWEVKAPLTAKVNHTSKAKGYITSKVFGLKGWVGSGFGGKWLRLNEKRENSMKYDVLDSRKIRIN